MEKLLELKNRSRSLETWAEAEILNLVTVLHTNKRKHIKNTHASKNRDNATGRVLEDRLSVYQTDS